MQHPFVRPGATDWQATLARTQHADRARLMEPIAHTQQTSRPLHRVNQLKKEPQLCLPKHRQLYVSSAPAANPEHVSCRQADNHAS
eukprot:scaffold373673_cov22-Prasinocladus_malaysianus.AAC.1